MRSFRILIAGVAALIAPILSGADTPVDLVQQSVFKPVVMHGRPSAAYGWYLFDGPRYRYIRGENKYLSGEKCFELDFADGAMTLTWSDPLPIAYTHPKYKKHPVTLNSRVAWPAPPAPRYRTVARVKFDKGGMSVAGRKIAPKSEWQSLDIVTSAPFECFEFTPVAGGAYSFARAKCFPVYPEVGGAIELPDGGRLERFLLPEDADYITRWGVAMWRGWLWKLTGVALPIETVKTVKPTPGAFAAVPGETAPGGWKLTVDKAGIVLTYGDRRVIGQALFDYLRMGLGCSFYGPDTIRRPADGTVKKLAAIDREAKPRFHTLTLDQRFGCFSGASCRGLFHTANDCDYYHLANPQIDHVLNVVLPGELYFDKHPEYFMLDRFGKRVKVENPLQINPCYSSKEGVETMARNLVDYAKGQSLAKTLIFSPGDAFTLCLCPECVKLNGGIASNSDSLMKFTNIFMPMLAKVRPDMKLINSAYASHHTLPIHVKPEASDVIYDYCLGHDVLPCTLHVDCAANRRGIKELQGFMKLAGSPANLGIETYRDVRPIHHLEQLEHLNRFAQNNLHVYLWKGYSPATAFVTTRWNLGEDPRKLVEEFDRVYYGKGGKFVHEINLVVEEFARNYKHTSDELNYRGIRHLCVWGGDLNSRTLLDRKTFDRIYALFDRALDSVGDDETARRHILAEKKIYLAEDLMRYNRVSCASKDELAAFSKRLAELIRCARRAPSVYGDVIYGVPGREFVMAVAGWEIPDTGKFWANEPAVDKFLDDPAVAFRPAAGKIPGGLYFGAACFTGKRLPNYYGDQCPIRMTGGVTRKTIGKEVMEAVFELDRAPASPLVLSLEGLDDDKPGASLFKIEVNGHEVYSGPDTFPEHQWGRMAWSVAPECFNAGENRVRITNITPDLPSRSARFSDPEAAKADSQWGWILISEMMLFDPSGDFDNFAAGRKDTAWRLSTEGLKAAPGKVSAGDGKVTIRSGEAPYTRIACFRSHKFPKIVMPQGGAVRFTVTASGRGKLRLGVIAYRGYRLDERKMQIIDRSGYTPGVNHYNDYLSPLYELSSEAKEYVFTARPSPVVSMFFPDIRLVGEGEVTVTGVKVEILPPGKK